MLLGVETPTGEVLDAEAELSSLTGAGVEAAIVILKLGSEALLEYPPEEDDDCGRLKRAASGLLPPPEDPPPSNGLPPVNGDRRPFNKFNFVLIAVCANWKKFIFNIDSINKK